MARLCVFMALCALAAVARAQSFDGVYAVGTTTFTVRALTQQDGQDGLFNVVYARGNQNGTMASATENPEFEFVFDEHLGDRYLGTFYFTKAWKGKPLEGYYVKHNGKKRVPVKFLAE